MATELNTLAKTVLVEKEKLLNGIWPLLRLITQLPLLRAGFELTCEILQLAGNQAVSDLGCLEHVWKSKVARTIRHFQVFQCFQRL
jgi:hypothetical protein